MVERSKYNRVPFGAEQDNMDEDEQFV